MLWTILIAFIVLIGAVLGYAAMRPDSFRIERSATIQAPPEKVFALVNDLHAWTGWSPWENLDPSLKRRYEGAASGTGAVYGWEGNSKVGTGRMEIVASTPPQAIRIKLDFLKPFEAHNIAEFTFARVTGGVAVNWAMHGPSPFVSKLMGLAFNMDRMVGGQFAQGLANLKAAAERA